MLTRLFLTGALAGQTVNLRAGLTEYKFVDGAIELEGPPQNIAGVVRYLGICYQAFPEGSEELRRAQELFNGPTETGPGSQAGNAGGGTEHAGGAGSQPTQPTDPAQSGGASPAPAGAEGGGADPRSGQSAMEAALKSLDPDNDNLWTQDGRPKISAVEAALGRTDITRDEVAAALPGFNREAARGNR